MSRAKKSMIAVVVLGLAVAWLICAFNYSESAAIGRYTYKQTGESGTIQLNADHTFQQRVAIDGKTKTAQGRWFLFGEAHLSFSSSFIPLRGEEPAPDGERFGEIHRFGGLFVYITRSRYNILWYGKQGHAGDSSLPGTYVGDEEGIPATITLNTDHGFSQDVTVGGTTHHATGQRRELANGNVSFSQEFLKDDGHALSAGEAAGSAVPPRGSNLQIDVQDVTDAHPVLRKKYLP